MVAYEPAAGAVFTKDRFNIRATHAVFILMLDKVVDGFDMNGRHDSSHCSTSMNGAAASSAARM